MVSIYALLRDLQGARDNMSNLAAMEIIARTLRTNLDPAWKEYEQLEDEIYDLRKEVEELREMIRLVVAS